jgi:hypothetical protein
MFMPKILPNQIEIRKAECVCAGPSDVEKCDEGGPAELFRTDQEDVGLS